MKRLYFILVLLMMSMYTFAQTHGRVIRLDSTQLVDSTELASGLDEPTYFKHGDTVTIQGVVIFNPKYYAKSATSRKATWLVDTSLKEWGGQMIFIDPGALSSYSGDLDQLNGETKFYENFVPGYTIKATGVLGHYNNNTQLYLIPIESEIIDIPTTIDTAKVVEPVVATIDEMMKNDGAGGMQIQKMTGEKYEGMFVRFENVTVVDVSDRPGYGGARKFWSVQDASGNKMQIDDNSGYWRNDANASASWCNDYVQGFLSEGTQLNYIQGVIEENGSYGYQINPLLPTDVDVAAAAPFISNIMRDPVVASSSDDVTISADIRDNDGSITSAKLYYSVGLNNLTFTEVVMTKTTGNTYIADIPAQADGAYVNYWIKATDNNGLVTNIPDSNATGSLYKVVDGGITTIAQIQETPFGSGNSIWDDAELDMTIGGIVTATLDQLGNVGVQSGTGPWSGIMLRAQTGDGLADLKLGDSIVITKGTITEEYNVTFIFNAGGPNHSVISHNNPLPAYTHVAIDSFVAGAGSKGEAFESVLLEFEDVYVVSQNPDDPSGNYGEWAVGQDTNNVASAVRVDDMSRAIEGNFNVDTLALNQHLDFIRGLMYYSFGNWKLAPRDKNDIAGYYTDTTTIGINLLNDQEISLKLYPNPTADQLYLEGNMDELSQLHINVYSVSGQLLFTNNYEVNGSFLLNVDVENLQSGMYFIEIAADNNRSSISKFYKK
jgi:hypothetical protein